MNRYVISIRHWPSYKFIIFPKRIKKSFLIKRFIEGLKGVSMYKIVLRNRSEKTP